MLALAMAASVALLLVAEYRGWRAGIWLAKPLASTVFVVAGSYFGVADSTYTVWVGRALLLSWLGDVLLIPSGRPRVFQAGIAAFALAHVAYIAAFAVYPLDVARAALVAVPALAALFLAARWLRPHLPADLRLSVYVYMGIITAMVIAAGSAWPSNVWSFVGAVMFYLSDLTVARARFVTPGFANSLVGLPLYYAAQLVLAYSAPGSMIAR